MILYRKELIKLVIRRVIAYIIDTLIIVFASSMLASISYLNPQLKKYEEVYKEYNEFYEDYRANIKNIKDKKSLKEYKTKLEEVNYKLDKNNIYGTIISIVLTVTYFAVFQKYNGGQTLGKKITSIKISNDLSLPKYLLRTIILHETWINALKVLLILIISKKHYILVTNALAIVSLVIEVTIIIMVSMRNDNRGLHDIIVGSKVILVPKERRVE